MSPTWLVRFFDRLRSLPEDEARRYSTILQEVAG